MDERRACLQPLDDGWLHRRPLRISMLRLDRLHPVVSGNKWYKLKGNVAAALQEGCPGIATFGGAYSNHLAATAAAAREAGLASVGFVRGLHHGAAGTDTLRFCAAQGMQLEYISTADYSRKNDPEYFSFLRQQHPGFWFVPEGGANEQGRSGAETIARLVPGDATHVVLSVGTGTTFIGLRNALPAAVAMTGFVPMKSGRYLETEIRAHLRAGQDRAWSLIDAFHFGGFGRTNQELMDFMVAFYNNYRIPLDVVYTGKMMYGLRQLLQEGIFPDGAHIVCLHTGGLQGNPPELRSLFAQSDSD